MKGDVAIGAETTVKIVKNKVSPPFKKVDVELIFGKGLSKEGEIITLAEAADLINKSGSWYSYNGERIGQGRENVRQFLIENPQIAQDLESKIRNKASSLDFEKISPEEEAEANKVDTTFLSDDDNE